MWNPMLVGRLRQAMFLTTHDGDAGLRGRAARFAQPQRLESVLRGPRAMLQTRVVLTAPKASGRPAPKRLIYRARPLLTEGLLVLHRAAARSYVSRLIDP